jgi:HEAT repeat protein
VATTPDQDREVQKENDLEALRQALLKGSEDPTALPAVVGRLANPNAEVRAEAVDAAIHLGDTNAIPALNNAVQHVEDPHEKVALLQAVAYLSLPSREATPRTNVVREPGKKPFKARRPNAGPAARFGTNQVPGIGVPGQ